MSEMDKMNRRVSDLVKQVKDIKDQVESSIEGNGLIVLHNTRIDVDASVRITELLKKISDLEGRVTYLESIVGSETSTESTEPVVEFRIGNFRFYAPGDGNTLYKQADLHKGLTTNPNWETREDQTI